MILAFNVQSKDSLQHQLTGLELILFQLASFFILRNCGQSTTVWFHWPWEESRGVKSNGTIYFGTSNDENNSKSNHLAGIESSALTAIIALCKVTAYASSITRSVKKRANTTVLEVNKGTSLSLWWCFSLNKWHPWMRLAWSRRTVLLYFRLVSHDVLTCIT